MTTRAPIQSKGFCCRACPTGFLWVDVRADDYAAGTVAAIAQARDLGWHVSGYGNVYTCPDCREVKV